MFGKTKKLYKSAVKHDYGQQYKYILEADIFLTIEGLHITFLCILKPMYQQKTPVHVNIIVNFLQC